MKFFTREYAEGPAGDPASAREVLRAYDEYLERFRVRLPAGVAVLYEAGGDESLHDGCFIESGFRRGTLSVRIEGYEWRDLMPPDPLDFVIRYEDASPVGISRKELLRTLGDPDAEIYFAEFDVREDGRFEHRMLLQAPRHGEIAIAFHDASVELRPWTSPRWRDACDDWEVDGFVRGIYIEATSEADWQRMVDHIRSLDWPCSYSEGGETVPMPESVGEIFEAARTVDVLWVSTPAPDLHIHCHFVTADEIEFDLDPSQVVGQPELDSVADFLRAISYATQKPALVCWENCPAAAIMACDPTTGRVSPGAAMAIVRSQQAPSPGGDADAATFWSLYPLAKLHHAGALSSEEFEEAKQHLLRAVSTTPPGEVSPADSQEHASFDVLLTDAGDRRIEVMRVVRTFTGMGLSEAGAFVDNPPGIVMRGVSRGLALSVKAMLEEIGAKVEVK